MSAITRFKLYILSAILNLLAYAFLGIDVALLLCGISIGFCFGETVGMEECEWFDL